MRTDKRRVNAKTRWEVRTPTHDAATLCNGTGTFIITDRDSDLLLDLFHYNYLAVRHLEKLDLFPGRKRASRRLLRLLEEGVIARTTVSAWRGSEEVGWEYTFALTQLGFECLLERETEGVAEFATRWNPPFMKGGDRNNPVHDAGVADLALGGVDYFGTRYSPTWMGSRSVTQEISRSRGRRSLSPDAGIVLRGPDTTDLLLLEFEESLRSESLQSRLDRYAVYFVNQLWKKKFPTLTQAPRVLISASTRSDRQRYWKEPFKQVGEIAQRMVALYPYVFLIEEEAWRNGLWNVRSLDPDARILPLHKVCVTPPLVS